MSADINHQCSPSLTEFNYNHHKNEYSSPIKQAGIWTYAVVPHLFCVSLSETVSVACGFVATGEANKKRSLSPVFTTSEMHCCYEDHFEGKRCYASQNKLADSASQQWDHWLKTNWDWEYKGQGNPPRAVGHLSDTVKRLLYPVNGQNWFSDIHKFHCRHSNWCILWWRRMAIIRHH